MLHSLFALGRKPNLTRMLQNGALIVDVRTPDEFRQGHAPGAINIPLETLLEGMNALEKQRPIITCCRSGILGASATAMLTSNGFMARNGGTWQNVAKHVPTP